MLNYIFKARNTEGVSVSGQICADCRETVVTSLKQKGYYLLSIEAENRLLAIFHLTAGLGRRVRVKEKAIFTHQLATLLAAGMQLTTALKTLSGQTQNKYLSSVIGQIHRDIEQSSSLSEAMGKHSKVFSKVYTAIVGAAEQSGSLAGTLCVLSKQLKAQASVNSRISRALVYPVFLLVVSGAIVCVLTTFVIPKFMELFVRANQTLPLPTKVLIYGTDILKNFWPILMLAIGGGVCFGLAALRNERLRLSADKLLLELPLIGSLNRKLQVARFARTLGSLLGGGVKMVPALNTTKGTTSNYAFAGEIGNIEQAILKGEALGKTVGQRRYFSQTAANMIAVGEDSGTLPQMLEEVADMYEDESESAIGSMTDMLGPVMIVILGLIIGFVVMAILLPIFETGTMVG